MKVSGVNTSTKTRTRGSHFIFILQFATGMAKARTRAPVSDEPITQRIHVGGLAASVTPKELVQRFSSFGQVKGGLQGVSGLGVAPSGKYPSLLHTVYLLS